MRDFKIRIFADGADINEMNEMRKLNYISGFTTNPTLLKKSGVIDYLSFAREAVKKFSEYPLSLEVIEDEGNQMEKEARILSRIGENVFVKIPIVSSRGKDNSESIRRLSEEGLKLNVTAVFTSDQIKKCKMALTGEKESYISVFAGRIADTGRSAVDAVKEALSICREKPEIKILWASCREIYNIVEAENAGCHIITVTTDILRKMKNLDKDLDVFSVETAKMFHDDAMACGLMIE